MNIVIHKIRYSNFKKIKMVLLDVVQIWLNYIITTNYLLKLYNLHSVHLFSMFVVTYCYNANAD